MYLQEITSDKLGITHIASIRSLSSVSANMTLQGTTLCKLGTTLTHITYIWRLSSVSAIMPLQFTIVRKLGATLEFLLSGVTGSYISSI